MEKKVYVTGKNIYALYEIIIASIICLFFLPFSINYTLKLFKIGFELKEWYQICLMGLGYIMPIIVTCFPLIHCACFESDEMWFHHFPWRPGWEKNADNIDMRWNLHVYYSEIDKIEIVKLTKKEKKEKTYFFHFINKYLKIILKSGSVKYVNVGFYSNTQIKKIILFLLELSR